jgi:hypothetical protein
LLDDVATVKPDVPPIPDAIDIRPANGSIFRADVSGLSVDFAGFTDAAAEQVEIQILSSADAPITESSWVTVGTATSASTATTFNDAAPIFRWSATITPVPDDRSGDDRWTNGGLLRFRTVAVDASGKRTALPFFDASSGTCVAQVLAKSWKDVLKTCKSPFSPELGAAPGGDGRAAALVSARIDPARIGLFDPDSAPDYLSRKGFIFTDETDDYYDLIEAPRTLSEFQDRFGFSEDDDNTPFADDGEVTATYFNRSDLGIGREMHCATFTLRGTPGTACYVRNYGTDDDGQPVFSGDPASALEDAILQQNSFATVAMVKFGTTFSPPDGNDVQFFVYNANDDLVNQAQLDNVASNEAIPNNCLNCHGGLYDRDTATVTGATFLPFDPESFLYATTGDFTFEAQREELRALNAMVKHAGAPPAIAQFIDGLYGAKVDQEGAKENLDWIPAGFSDDEESKVLYREVIKPYCRTCHMSQTGDFAFMRTEDFKKQNSLTNDSVCHQNDMPVAEATMGLFWPSSARAYLVNSLGLSTSCAPFAGDAQ